MWYVNTNVISTIKGTTKSFILTMWYVNFENDEKIYNCDESFILTMWYLISIYKINTIY